MPAGAESRTRQALDDVPALQARLVGAGPGRIATPLVARVHRRLIALRRSEPDLSSHDRKLVGTAFDEQAGVVVNRYGSVGCVQE